MNKRDFFLQAMKAGRYKEKDWVMAAFSILRPQGVEGFSDMKPFDILYIQRESGQGSPSPEVVFIDDNGNNINVDDYDYDNNDPQPPYTFGETFTLEAGEVPNLSQTIETTYGNLLANYILLIDPFQHKIDYMQDRFSIKDIEKIVEQRLTSDPDDEGDRDPDTIYVRDYKRYQKAAGYINGLSQLVVPSATAKSMTRHPDTEKLRDELIEENKGHLKDPAVIAKIEEKLKELDLEHLAGDESMGFYIKSKSLDPVRKKAHLITGLEQAFGDRDTAELIVSSLEEGIDVEKMPALVNGLREGSFDRGAQTQLGGVATKTILRVMQNSKITQQDCGSTIGVATQITDQTKEQYIGNFILKDQTPVELTEENIDQYVGKTVDLRSPLFCWTADDDFCMTCIGRRYENQPNGLATAAANVGSTFVSIFLASMHGTALKTKKYDPMQHLY